MAHNPNNYNSSPDTANNSPTKSPALPQNKTDLVNFAIQNANLTKTQAEAMYEECYKQAVKESQQEPVPSTVQQLRNIVQFQKI